jgi:hypothetical protein
VCRKGNVLSAFDLSLKSNVGTSMLPNDTKDFIASNEHIVTLGRTLNVLGELPSQEGSNEFRADPEAGTREPSKRSLQFAML